MKMFGKFNKKSNNKLKNKRMVSTNFISKFNVFTTEEPFKMERWKKVEPKI